MVKIWAEAFWKNDTRQGAAGETVIPIPAPMWIAMALMALATLSISLYPEWIFAVVQRAGEELMDPQRYIQAVLNP
jgi:multicomponent Na+:H+ antiporter subunit D